MKPANEFRPLPLKKHPQNSVCIKPMTMYALQFSSVFVPPASAHFDSVHMAARLDLGQKEVFSVLECLGYHGSIIAAKYGVIF